MDIESVRCECCGLEEDCTQDYISQVRDTFNGKWLECCGLEEDCTQDYISQVRDTFNGKWLCGLCSEAVRDEVIRGNNTNKKKKSAAASSGMMEDAVRAHMSFCGKFNSNPAVRVADGMRQMLRRRSGELSSSPPPSSKKYSRSASTKLY